MFLILPTGLTQGVFPKWAVMLNALGAVPWPPRPWGRDPVGPSRAPLTPCTRAGRLGTGFLTGEVRGHAVKPNFSHCF